jgi:DNA-binding response OmpR family regulator
MYISSEGKLQQKEPWPTMARKILVADDDRSSARLIESCLDRAGYEVVVVCDGHDALCQAKTGEFDLVVLDSVMPRKNGSEVLQELRENPSTESTPVVMIADKMSDTGTVGVWQSRALYIEKPFDPRLLLTQVERIFEKIDEEAREDEGPW